MALGYNLGVPSGFFIYQLMPYNVMHFTLSYDAYIGECYVYAGEFLLTEPEGKLKYREHAKALNSMIE